SPVSVFGGSFSCSIPSPRMGANLVSIRAFDLAGNIAGTHFHVYSSGPGQPPASLKITPDTVTMLVGDTQQFTAVAELNQQRTDATWTVSDISLASITTDGSPVLTSLAPGLVTLTATVFGQSAHVVITMLSGTSLPPGTVRWSASPLLPGAAVESVLQA